MGTAQTVRVCCGNCRKKLGDLKGRPRGLTSVINDDGEIIETRFYRFRCQRCGGRDYPVRTETLARAYEGALEGNKMILLPQDLR